MGDTMGSLEACAHCWGIKPKPLIENLTKIVKKKFTKNVQFRKADGLRDSIAKELYSCLFDYIVRSINTQLQGEETEKGNESLRFIGVLDVFGFENFETNSIEQLCINFTNER